MEGRRCRASNDGYCGESGDGSHECGAFVIDESAGLLLSCLSGGDRIHVDTVVIAGSSGSDDIRIVNSSCSSRGKEHDEIEIVTEVASGDAEAERLMPTRALTIVFTRQIWECAESELMLIFSFLNKKEICYMSLMNRRLRVVSSKDSLWKMLFPRVLLVGSYEVMCQAFPAIAANVSKMGIKGAYNKFKTPPLVPPDKFVLEDFMIVLFTCLNTADFVTDVIVLTGFCQQGHYVYFWICFSFVILCAFLCFELFPPSLSRGQRCLNILLHFLQLRIIVETGKYFRERWRRYLLTGEVKEEVTSTINKTEEARLWIAENVAFMKFSKAVFESAPQSLLQALIVFGIGQIKYSAVNVVSILLSVISVSLSFARVTDVHNNYFDNAKHPRCLYFCVCVHMLVGLSFRLVAMTMFIASAGIQSSVPFLVIDYLANLILCRVLFKEVPAGLIFWAPLFVFLITLTPVTFNPYDYEWEKFNCTIFAFNWVASVGLCIFSLTASHEQEFWVEKLIFLLLCCILQVITFYILLKNEVKILKQSYEYREARY